MNEKENQKFQKLEIEKNSCKKNPRLDQDIHFVVSDAEFLLQLDTSYPGPEDMYLLRSVDRLFRAFGDIEISLCDLSERQDRYTVWDYPEDGLMRIGVESDLSDLNVTQGIFASLPDWNGDDFGFIGSQTLTELLQDIAATEGFDKKKGFFRSDGTRIEPGEVKEDLFEDSFERLAFEDEMDI